MENTLKRGGGKYYCYRKVGIDGRWGYYNLVEADAGCGHLAHHLGDVDLGGTGVGGADLEGSVVGDHLGEDVEDGLEGVMLVVGLAGGVYPEWDVCLPWQRSYRIC